MSYLKSALHRIVHPRSGFVNPKVDEKHTPQETARQIQSKKQKEEDEHRLREKKEASKQREAADRAERERKINDEYRNDPLNINYGIIPHGGAPINQNSNYTDLATLTKNNVGDEILFRARVHTCRHMSAKLAFVVFRQHSTTIQGVISFSENHVSEKMVRFAERLPLESVVLVQGTVKEAKEEVKSTDVHLIEIDVKKLHVISEVTEHLPFRVEHAARPKEDIHENGFPDVSLHRRLEHRMVDLRTPTNQAIFRIQAGVCKLVREYLEERNFMEIHSAKLQQTATESGASVFKVDYFKRSAYLAQSPQVGKEIAISADFERVYEIGPVFRAENSNTHRHMTEFTGIDVEMVIDHDYYEALHVIDGMLRHVFNGLNEHYSKDIDIVKRQFPHETFTFPEETVVLKFAEGVKMLRDDGWGMQEGKEVDEYEDLSTHAEVRLGQLIKEKYNTDYYILDKFPRSARPFYTMPDVGDPKLTNSWDFFCRGEEILSGGQRLHSAKAMEASMKDARIDPADMKEYIDAYRWGMPPHAGGGIGLERLVMLFLDLGNLRFASLFPRDPKSFPGTGNVTSAGLPAPKHGVPAFTEPVVLSRDDMKKDHHPPLTDLISKYGDSTNTAWTDPMYEVWREEKSGAAIGFIESKGFAVTWGVPLCERDSFEHVIRSYLDWLERQRLLKPLWLAADDKTERFLADEFNWRVVTVISEQRIDVSKRDAIGDNNVRRKRERAEKEGIRFEMIEEEISPELQAEIEQGIHAWQESREGTQIHTTNVRPFADSEHRCYCIARDKEGKICGLIVLARLSKEHGYQIKWSLAFPDSPKGTSEFLVSHAIEEMQKAGVQSATFGVGASDTMEPVDNLGGLRTKALSEAYGSIAKGFHLTNKSDYRRKFAAEDIPLYVCYPKHGLGWRGIEAIVGSVRESPKKDKANGDANSGASSKSFSLNSWRTNHRLKGAPSDVAAN